MATPHVVVVGSANVDMVTCVARLPKPGETLLGGRFSMVPGGKGANQAVAAARLGADTAFIGALGEDTYADFLHSSLEAEGINLEALELLEDVATGTATILVSDAGENMIVVASGANYALTPAHVQEYEGLIAQADALLVQMETPAETVAAALALARKHDVLGVLDIGSDQPVPDDVLRAAAIVSPNASEAARLTGLPVEHLADAGRAAEALLEKGVREVVLKLGADGALWRRGSERVHVPAFSITPVDTTAAGDAFTAALACAWAGKSPAEALRFANAAGAIAATRAGAQPAMPRKAEVDELMKQAAATSVE